MADKMGELKGNKLTQTRSERLSRIQYKLEEVNTQSHIKKENTTKLGKINFNVYF